MMEKWIPVEERKPETEGNYLCRECMVDENDQPTHVWTAILEYRFGKWWSSCTAPACITHWMPLPAPPEEEAE